MNDFYVYVVFRLDGRPCYVGKGRGPRWRLHNAGRSRNPHLAAIIGKYGELPVAKVRGGLSEAEAFATEIAFIAAIGRTPNDGPLVNLTDGGEGASGYKHVGRKRGSPSIETRQKIAEANTGKKHSAETRAKISAVQIGRKIPMSTRAAMTGRKMSAESSAKKSAALKGRVFSEETRGKISAAMKGRRPSSECMAKATAACSGKSLSNEHKRKLSERHRGKPWSEARRSATLRSVAI